MLIYQNCQGGWCACLVSVTLLFLSPHSVNAEEISKSYKFPVGLIWGEATNGLRAAASARDEEGDPARVSVEVFVAKSAGPGKQIENPYLDEWDRFSLYFGEKLPYTKTNLPLYGVYFLGTNSFCGPIQLRDAAGKELRLLDPTINSEAAYPPSYSLSEVRSNYRRLHPISGGPVFPISLKTAFPQLVAFRLGDYFEIGDSTEYHLTIWPKIYKRAATNADLCIRIDLPPVERSIKRKPGSLKKTH
jgi:hypothetical protein